MSEDNLPPLVFLQGKRVVLRPILKSDLSYALRWINDPEVNTFLGAFLPMMEADEEAWFEGLHKRKPNDVVFAIVVDGVLIGNMGLHRISWKDGIATTGALIGNKEYWGQGYGTEAKMLLLNWAFNELNLRKICSVVYEYNKRSYAYSMKCGYKLEGTLKAHRFAGGRYWDELHLAVFREDWLPLWEKFKETNLS